MRYLNQDATVERLGQDAKKLLRDRVEKPAGKLVMDGWADCRRDIEAYARGVWGQHGAHGGPAFAEHAKQRIIRFMDKRLAEYQRDAQRVLGEAKRQAFTMGYLMSTWILDQTTPPNVKVRPRGDVLSYYRNQGKGRVTEAWAEEPITGQDGEDGEASGEQRVSGWLKAWQLGAVGGLILAGVQGDTATDVESRINTATADGRDIGDVMGRLIQSEVQVQIAKADVLVFDEQREVVTESLWATMEDEGVCDDCEEQEGKPEAEWTAPMPAHPWCRCWRKMVPKNYQELAGDQGTPGLAKRSMVFRDPQTGEPVGVVTIEFTQWAQSILD